MNRRVRLDAPTLAIFASLVMAVMVLIAIQLPRLSFVNPKASYTAELASTGGLHVGDPVKVGGVQVGEVEKLALVNQHVRATFTANRGLALGDQSRAEVQLSTVLGNTFLQIESQGSGRLALDGDIPLSRTSVPYSLLGTAETFATKASEIDKTRLRQSLTLLTKTLDGISRSDVDATVGGLADVTHALADRGEKLSELMDSARALTDTLERRSGALVAVLQQSDVFLRMLEDRHEAVRALLRDTSSLSKEITTLMKEDGAPLTTALATLDTLSQQFAKDAASIRKGIKALSVFSVNIANVTGNGPWLDVYLPAGLIPDNVFVACGPSPTPGCGQ